MGKKYKPITILASTALVALFASVFLFGQKAEAAPLLNQQNTTFNFGGLLSRQAELDFSSSIVAEKAKEVEIVQVELQTVVEQKTSLETEVATLKEQVANLDDLFVKINRYAPDSRGNTYAWGNCTLYAKSKRPDASNSWGNANTWYARAKAQGWNVGTLPKKGAIATSTDGWLGHVAYVEGMSLDRQWVTISEMNYVGLNRTNTRTVHYTEFRYIYELN